MSTSNYHERGSADKGRKRQRDRDNQRRKRLKEKEILLNLQNENASLKQQVGLLSAGSNSSEEARHISDMLEEITAQNEALRKQVAAVNEFVTSWTSLGTDGCQRHNTKFTQKLTPRDRLNILNEASSIYANSHDAAQTTDYDDAFLPTPELDDGKTLSITICNAPKQPETNKSNTGQPSEKYSTAEWQRLPVLISDYEGCGRPFDFAIELLQSQPDFAKFCTPYPKILDILLGGSLNELANAVFRVLAQSTISRPERIAISWNGYLFIRVSHFCCIYFFTLMEIMYSGQSSRLLKVMVEFHLHSNPPRCNSKFHIPAQSTTSCGHKFGTILLDLDRNTGEMRSLACFSARVVSGVHQIPIFQQQISETIHFKLTFHSWRELHIRMTGYY